MPYQTIEEAVEIANGTRYGLGASVFGPDQRQALSVAKQLECGMVSVNDFGVFYVSIDSTYIWWFTYLNQPLILGGVRNFWFHDIHTLKPCNCSQDLPFGGAKYSGYGRFGGPEGLRSLTNAKAIMVDRWPSFIQTSIPKVLDYPIRSMKQSWYVHCIF